MNNQPWYQRFPKDEFGGEQSLLTCEEYGFFTRLRDFCWENDGMLLDEKILKRFAQAQKLSPYKFKKVWEVVENFFEKIDGKLRYADDERKRLEVVDRSRNCKVSGIKGANSRWKRQMPLDLPMANFTDGDRHPEKEAFAMSADGYPEPSPHPEPDTYMEYPAAASSFDGSSKASRAAAAGTTNNSVALDVSASYVRAVVLRCSALGLPTPDRGICSRLKQRFPNLDPSRFPAFPGQQGAGLWLFRSEAEMGYEADRMEQGPWPARKPSKLQDALTMVDRDFAIKREGRG
jgi:uncharacterized protein YdaU (DUF1376 family)